MKSEQQLHNSDMLAALFFVVSGSSDKPVNQWVRKNTSHYSV